MVTGRVCLAQALVRRLTTPRGRLIDDANYGFDLRSYLDDDLGVGDLARVRAGIDAECLKDERVSAASSTVQMAGGVMIIAIVITDGDGPFNLVLSVSQVTTSILAVT